jgi:hypothetical protein
MNLRDDDVVVVAQKQPRFLFHDPDKLPSTIGMVTKMGRQVKDTDLEPCSKCFGTGVPPVEDYDHR